MKGLDALNNIKREAGVPYFSMLYDIDMWKEDFETIEQYLKILDLFVEYSSIKYFKDCIEDDLFTLRNFDLDTKDIKNISKRIQETEILISFIIENRGGIKCL